MLGCLEEMRATTKQLRHSKSKFLRANNTPAGNVLRAPDCKYYEV